MKLLELPPDVLIDNILLHLDAVTLTRLSSTCRSLKTLADDEFLWKHRVFQDYNLPHDASFRHSGWKTLYAQLSSSAVYTWGENSDRRLGHSQETPAMRPMLRGHRARIVLPNFSVSKPREVTALRGKGIVDIMAGGWSFHALDRHGRVWMWGTMQEDVAYSISLGTRRIETPTQVELPEDTRIRSLSCGRSHAIGLAQDGSVWHWNNLWAPQQVHIPTDGHVVQVTANWGYSSVLTSKGELFIVPQPPMIRERPKGLQDPMEMHMPGVTLANLDLDTPQNDRIVQVTGLEKYTIALTKTGRVIKLRTEPVDDFVISPAQNAVELSKFGAVEPEDNDRCKRMYRFITGQFRSFAVYTADGKVLLGDQNAQKDTEPRILSELQRDICKVTFGDYHSGALTNQGELLTWGGYSSGALGHGDAQSQEEQAVPKSVEALQDKFVFAVGFGGWHSGALAIPRT